MKLKSKKLQQLYTKQEIDYFSEIVFSSEYGSNLQRIRKWTEDIRIEVLGSPTSEDQQELNRVIKDLNEIIEPIQLHLVDKEPSTKIYFVPPEEFEKYISEALGAYGFFWITYNSKCEIYKATILISTEVTKKGDLIIIREEVTQSLVSCEIHTNILIAYFMN